MHPENTTLSLVTGDLAPLPFLTQANPLARFWRWLIPDTSAVKAGTLWIRAAEWHEARPTLIHVVRTSGSGPIQIERLSRTVLMEGKPLFIPRDIEFSEASDLVRNFKPITRERARQLGFSA